MAVALPSTRVRSVDAPLDADHHSDPHRRDRGWHAPPRHHTHIKPHPHHSKSHATAARDRHSHSSSAACSSKQLAPTEASSSALAAIPERAPLRLRHHHSRASTSTTHCEDAPSAHGRRKRILLHAIFKC